MKPVLNIFLGLGLWALTSAVHVSAQTDAASWTQTVRWYGQNSLRLELGGLIVWIDPVTVPTTEKADVILVTHSHSDHFAPAKIKRLKGPKTQVWVAFSDFDHPQIRPGEVKTSGGLTITAVPMYDLHDQPHHEKTSGFCGFVLEANGLRVYVAGDAGRMPELKTLQADVAFLPLGPVYTMLDVDDAVGAAMDTRARVVVPVHYGTYEGSDTDADAFVTKLKARGVSSFRLPTLN